MSGALPPDTALYLAVLCDRATATAGGDTVCAVLAYDGRGRRHLRPVDATPSLEELHRLLGGDGPVQLPLPLLGALPAPTSVGRCWQTWVLPSIPPPLRTLPPEQLADALADRLLTGVAS